jgi:hypothetical protein
MVPGFKCLFRSTGSIPLDDLDKTFVRPAGSHQGQPFGRIGSPPRNAGHAILASLLFKATTTLWWAQYHYSTPIPAVGSFSTSTTSSPPAPSPEGSRPSTASHPTSSSANDDNRAGTIQAEPVSASAGFEPSSRPLERSQPDQRVPRRSFQGPPST